MATTARIISFPQRHGTLEGAGPQILDIPQELIDMIEAYIPQLNRTSTIISLRLTCHTFAEGLFHTFATSCLAKKATTKQFLCYLDDRGIKELEWLAQSRLAPFVRHIKLADRVPSGSMLEFQDVDEATKAHNLEHVAATKNSSIFRSLDEKYGKYEVYHRYPCDEYNQNLGCYSMNDCQRQQRHRTAFETAHPGWTARWADIRCTDVRDMDLRPSGWSLRCLAIALTRFTSLEHLSTGTAQQVIGHTRSADGRLMGQTILHGSLDWHTQGRTVIQCALYCRCRLIEDKLIEGFGFYQTDVIWPAMLDLGRLAPWLAAHQDLPLFNTLKILDLKCYSNIALDSANNIQQTSAPHLASFMSRCSALQEIYIRTSRGDGSTAVEVVSVVETTIKHLANRNTRYPHLKILHLEHIDPIAAPVAAFISTHAPALEELFLPSCLATARDDVIEPWAMLLGALTAATSLSSMVLDFCCIHDSRSKTEIEIVQALVKLKAWEGNGLGEWMRRMLGALRKWDGTAGTLEKSLPWRGDREW